MSFRMHAAPTPMLFGYDPIDLPINHLVWLVEKVVEEAIRAAGWKKQKGQPAFNPKLCAKILIYGYATGIRSSRQLERLCHDSLPFLLLTRGDAPSYRTLCYFRINHADVIEEIFVALYALADQLGLKRMGRIVIDSSKFRADASPEAVVKASEYDRMLQEFKDILKEASEADLKEDETPPGSLYLEKEAKPDQMREIIRRVRKQAAESKRAANKTASSKTQDTPQTPETAEAASQKSENAVEIDATQAPPELGPRMIPRIEQAIETIEAARKAGLKHACLTDPDARMMGEGRDKRIKECHSFEVAVDKDAGLLVAGQVTNEQDYSRLEPLIEAARENEPSGVLAVDADSGYYKGEVIARLEEQGIDTCVPDGMTAKRLRDGSLNTPSVSEAPSSAPQYDSEKDVFVCAAGKSLPLRQTRVRGGREVKNYRAASDCTGCALAEACGKKAAAKRRTVSRSVDSDNPVDVARSRFADKDHQQRYHDRGMMVETVFGFIRHILGFSRWTVRGKDRVMAESGLFKSAYQFRKVYSALKSA